MDGSFLGCGRVSTYRVSLSFSFDAAGFSGCGEAKTGGMICAIMSDTSRGELSGITSDSSISSPKFP